MNIGLWELSFLVNFGRAKEPDRNTFFFFNFRDLFKDCSSGSNYGSGADCGDACSSDYGSGDCGSGGNCGGISDCSDLW